MEVVEERIETLSESEQSVIFRLHDEYFCIDISFACEITELLPLNRVPKAPGFVAGAVNYHGKVVGVVSLARFFNLPSHERGALSRIIVLNAGEYSAGFLVDSIKEIVFIPDEDNPMEGDAFESRYVKRVVSIGSSLVNVLDVEKLLADLEDYFKEGNVEY